MGGEKQQQQTQVSHFFFLPLLLEPPPSPSVSEKLRVPPPANKAIRDGKDADTAAFGRHSEQKRKRRGRERGMGRGLKGGWRGGGEGRGERCLLWLSVKNVSPLCAVREDREKRGSFEKRGEKMCLGQRTRGVRVCVCARTCV